MAYTVRFSAKATKAIEKLQRSDQVRVLKAVERLAADPFAPGLDVKRLTAREGYRLRVGDLRVLYLIERDEVVVVVTDVANRREAYR